MYLSSIDGMEKQEIFALVIAADAGSKDSVELLIDKLEEKIAHTNELNIDCTGLSSILSLVDGILLDRQERHSIADGAVNEMFAEHIRSAVQELRDAIGDRASKASHVDDAKDSLAAAVRTLRAWFTA